MRRVEDLIDEIRKATENELPTAGDVTLGGLTDESIVHLLNRSQERLFSRLMLKYPTNFIKIASQNVTNGTEAYTLGTDNFLDSQIISVEWMYNDSTDFKRLGKATFHSRYTDTNGDPLWYIVQNNTILLNPIPDETKTNGLRITYYRMPRTIDKRRGYITTATKSGTTLTSLTMADPSTLLAKDADLDVAGNAVLTEVDYICIVDKDGASILDGIAVDSYNTSTRVLTMSSGVTTAIAAATLQNNYIVMGKSATSHSEFPENYERYLTAYVEQAILRRDGNDVEANIAIGELRAFEKDIEEAAGQETDTFDTPLDEHWLTDNDIW